MNHRPEQDNLLDDVLAESAPAEFRASTLSALLQHAARQRRVRRVRRGVVFVVVFGLVGLLGWYALSPRSGRSLARPGDYEIVQTRPLPREAVIRTQPWTTLAMVFTQPCVEIVSTRLQSHELRLLSDNELLVLALPRKAALVRLGPHAQKLILLPEADTSPPVN